LRIAPAGWSYPDWSGFVYPPRRPKNLHEATFLAQFFDTIEINAAFYQPVRQTTPPGSIVWPQIPRSCSPPSSGSASPMNPPQMSKTNETSAPASTFSAKQAS
jgi:hypothetical protein